MKKKKKIIKKKQFLAWSLGKTTIIRDLPYKLLGIISARFEFSLRPNWGQRDNYRTMFPLAVLFEVKLIKKKKVLTCICQQSGRIL